MRKLPFALLAFCCIDTAAGFRAAHIALPVQQKSARCTPLQLCTTPPELSARVTTNTRTSQGYARTRTTPC